MARTKPTANPAPKLKIRRLSDSSPNEEQKTNPNPVYDIIISGLDTNMTKDVLSDIFEGCEYVFICRNRNLESIGTALMKFSNQRDVNNVFEICKGMDSKTVFPTRIDLMMIKNNLLVYNIEPSVTSRDLMDLFSAFGRAKFLTPPTDLKGVPLGYSYIHFVDPENAKAAAQGLNETLLEGQPIKIQTFQELPRPVVIKKVFKAKKEDFTSGNSAFGNFGGFGGFGGGLQSEPMKEFTTGFGNANNAKSSETGLFGKPVGGGLGSGFGIGFGGGFSNGAVFSKIPQEKAVEQAPVPKTKAETTLEKMFESRMFADVVFEVQGEEILAHKFVIAENSKYFEDLASAEPLQPGMKKISISDVSSTTFKAMIEYMYTEQVKPDEDLLIELLKISDKYTIPDLKLKCEETLGSLLTLENFVKISQAIEEFQTSQLKESLLNFTMKNGSGMVEKDDMYDIPKTVLVDMIQKLCTTVPVNNNANRKDISSYFAKLQ